MTPILPRASQVLRLLLIYAVVAFASATTFVFAVALIARTELALLFGSGVIIGGLAVWLMLARPLKLRWGHISHPLDHQSV
jgi:hypothetical protein